MFRVQAVLLIIACLCLPVTEAAAQGYYRSYGGYYYYPRYNNTYHGYWRDLGYGFSNRPAYGSYYRSEGFWGGPYYVPPYVPYTGPRGVPGGQYYGW